MPEGPKVPGVPGVPKVPKVPSVPRVQGGEWQQSARKRAEVAAIATLGYPLLRTLGATWSWKVSGAEHVDAIAARGFHPIHAFWHGRILPATLYFRNRGIVVSDTMQTYDPRVYAVGECAEHRGTAYGLVAPLFEQAKVAANQLAQFGIGRGIHRGKRAAKVLAVIARCFGNELDAHGFSSAV